MVYIIVSRNQSDSAWTNLRDDIFYQKNDSQTESHKIGEACENGSVVWDDNTDRATAVYGGAEDLISVARDEWGSGRAR